jgi:NAD(P)-dependent dehydrogenase (short-subunit alcohol dehydrogenase family)
MTDEQSFPPQQQERPGFESQMRPEPRDEMRDYEGRGLLEGRAALITGGDSGIGRAVAIAFAKEGADVAIAYLSEDEDAEKTAARVEEAGRRCVRVRGDLSREQECVRAVSETVDAFGRLDVLVNNIAYQAPTDSLEEISSEQWDTTFKTNIYSYFWTTKAALAHLPDQTGAIINTSSINGLRGNKQLIDYSATKGAINAFTYAMAQSLADREIRVNAVAPGPVWTPLIPSTFDSEKVESFGQDVPMERAAQPDEIAPSYVFFASERLSSYYSGEILAPIGGETLPG